MEKHYSIHALLELIPYTRQYIYQLIDEGRFPRLTKLGSRRVGLKESRLREWFDWREKLQELVVTAQAESIAKAEQMLPSPFRTEPRQLSAAEAKKLLPYHGKKL